jgi:class 3 adenylate cyclase
VQKFNALGEEVIVTLVMLRYAFAVPLLVATILALRRHALWQRTRRHALVAVVSLLLHIVFMAQLGVALTTTDNSFDFAVIYLTHAFVVMLFQSTSFALPFGYLLATWGGLVFLWPVLLAIHFSFYKGLLALMFLVYSLGIIMGYGAYMLERSSRLRWVFNRSSEAERRRARIERDLGRSLMRNILPDSVIKSFTQSKSMRGLVQEFEPCTIFVSDIVNFTALATMLPPQELVELLAELFSSIDEAASRLGVEKVKTVGDSYIAVGGVPTQTTKHCAQIARLALEIQTLLAALNRRTKHRYKLAMRMGIHSGSVLAGVLGHYRYTYDLFGHSVLRAEEMESSGAPGVIHVSDEAAALLWPRFHLAEFSTQKDVKTPRNPSEWDGDTPPTGPDPSGRTWSLVRELDEEERVSRSQATASAPFDSIRNPKPEVAKPPRQRSFKVTGSSMRLQQVFTSVEKAFEEGLGIPGAVDPDDGTVRSVSSNISFTGSDLGEKAETIIPGSDPGHADVWSWISQEISELRQVSLDSYTLRYSSKAPEREFAAHWHRSHLPALQRGILSLVFLTVILDFVFDSRLNRTVGERAAQVGGFCGLWLVVVVLSFIDTIFARVGQWIIAAASLCSGVAIVIVGAIREPLLFLIIGGLYLGNTFLLKLRFPFAVMVTTLLHAAACSVIWFVSASLLDAIQLCIFLTAVAGSTVMAHYFQEKFVRRTYLDRKILMMEKTRFQIEQRKSKELLEASMPADVARELEASNGDTIAHSHGDAVIMFAKVWDKRFPELTVERFDELNDLLVQFDITTRRRGLEKIKTLEGTIMIAGNLSDEDELETMSPFEAMVDLALELREMVSELNTARGTQYIFRAGLTAGPVVAGVIGTKRWAYDMWGDPVNLASRMESTCEDNHIQIVAQEVQRLGELYVTAPRGQVTVKGKGKMATRYISKKKGPLSDYDSTANPFGLAPPDYNLVQAMKNKETGIKVGTRRHNFREYHKSFSGEELVSWLIGRIPYATRADAQAFGETLRQVGVFRHVVDGSKIFRDGVHFYEFLEPPDPARV